MLWLAIFFMMGELSDAEHADYMPWGDGDYQPPNESPSADVAQELLAELLVDCFLRPKSANNRMDAKQLCTICWLCAHAGFGGKFQDLALDPKSPSGHFSRHVKRVLG